MDKEFNVHNSNKKLKKNRYKLKKNITKNKK